MNCNDWPKLTVQPRVKPHPRIFSCILEYLCGQSPHVSFGKFIKTNDDLQYTILCNPRVEGLEAVQQSELLGLVCLIKLPLDYRSSFDGQELISTMFDRCLIWPKHPNWERLQRFLDRASLVNPRLRRIKYNFGIWIPPLEKSIAESRSKALAYDFALAGTISAASMLEKGLQSMRPCEFQFRPMERIIVESGSYGFTLTLVESFLTLDEKVFAAWICKQVAVIKDRGQGSWRLSISMTPPTSAYKMEKGHHIWMRWEVSSSARDSKRFRSILATIAVGFRPFLRHSMRQVWFKEDRISRMSVNRLLSRGI